MKRLFFTVAMFAVTAFFAGAGRLAGKDIPAATLESARQVLEQKVEDGRWMTRVYGQSLAEVQAQCGASASTAPPSPAGERFKEIATSLLRPSGRRNIEVLFLPCRPGFADGTTLTFGATILVFNRWLKRATAEDLWASAAHEMAHRPSDLFLNVLISEHLKANASQKARLLGEIEMRADVGAEVLLKYAGKDPQVLFSFLEKEQKIHRSFDLRDRIEALKAKTILASRN